MKKYIKIIVSIVICMFMIFLINSNEVSAAYLSKVKYQVDVNGADLEGSELILGTNHILCIQQGAHVSCNATYRVKYYIKIDGTKSSIYVRDNIYSSSANYRFLGDIYATENAKFSYIISQPDPTSNIHHRQYSRLQNEVYGYISTWMSKNYLISGIGINGGPTASTTWNTEATAYANKLSSGSATITNNTNKNKLTKEPYTYNNVNYTKVGPFNFSFNVDDYSDKKIYDQNGKDVTKDVYYACYNGKTLEVRDQINYVSESGKDFYLLVPTSVTKISKFTVSVKKEVKKIDSEIWILQQKEGWQNIMSTDSSTSIVKTEASASISDIDIPTITYIDLSGYVWEDRANTTKNEKMNGLYKANKNDTEDKLLQNVTVKLKNSSGKVVKSATTDEDGKYKFEKVLITDLPNLYIEFTYNGFNYQSISANLKNAKGNKSTDGGRETFNEDFATIKKGASYDTKGNSKNKLNYAFANNKSTINLASNTKNLKYGYNGAKYPINGVDKEYQISATTYNAYGGYLDEIISQKDILSSGTKEIQNINLGLKEREQPDLAVVTDLYSSKINISGENFTYLYEDRLQATNKDKDAIYNIEPKVKFGQERGSQTYSRPLYASDIKYTGTDGLEVKLTYRIGIHNQSTNLTTTVNEIVDYFDVKYDSKSIKVGTQLDENGNIKNSLKYTLENSENIYKNDYSKVRINTNLTLTPQSEAMVYIELIVRPNEIVKIIDQGQEVKLDNIAEIASYSTKDSKGNRYAGIDQDSQPENTIPGNTSTYEDDTDIAPGILLVLQEERTVAGTVFEDATQNETQEKGIRVGSGKYDVTEGDRGISGIQVTVREEDGDIAKVYNKETKKWIDAITTTNSNGDYSIKGFMPGRYYITYTWGGKEYILSDGTNKLITVQNYKGTIVDKQSYIAKATNDKWYKDTETRESDAIDNYETRKLIDNEITEITYKEKMKMNNGDVTYKTMESTTPVFKIEIEYPEGPIDASKEYETNADGSLKIENGLIVKKDGYKNIIKNIDFGIVERPRQVLGIDKRVTHIKLVLANGNCIIDADIDENGEIQGKPNYIAYLPKGDSSNAQIKLEIDSEIIQGARLEISYTLKVRNIGEYDYNTEEYYYYGPGNGEDSNKIVKLSANKLIDHLDDEVTIKETDTSWTEITNKNKLIEDGILSDTENMKEYLKTVDTLLTTEKMKGIELKPGEATDTASMTTTKILANDEETFIENEAEIISVTKKGGGSLSVTPGNYVPTDISTSELDNSKAEDIYVIPPTGLADIIPYILLGISTLLILASGIILIKKFTIK